MQPLRTCVQCKSTKHLGHYSSYYDGKDDAVFVVRSVCKQCRRDNANTQWASRDGRLKNRLYRSKYGISWFDKNRMVANQGGRCANHGCPESAQVLDHCHATGKIRGVLCRGCNTSLGFAKDRPETLRGLASYLEPKLAGAGEALLWL